MGFGLEGLLDFFNGVTISSLSTLVSAIICTKFYIRITRIKRELYMNPKRTNSKALPDKSKIQDITPNNPLFEDQQRGSLTVLFSLQFLLFCQNTNWSKTVCPNDLLESIQNCSHFFGRSFLTDKNKTSWKYRPDALPHRLEATFSLHLAVWIFAFILLQKPLFNCVFLST